MDSFSPRSYADTEDEIHSLYDAIDERDRYIATLEQEINGNASNTDLETCKGELRQCKDTISELQIQVKKLRGDTDNLSAEKAQLENTLSLQQSLLDQRSSFGKNKRDTLHRLEVENQRLNASVSELEQNEDILVDEIDTLVGQKSKFQDQFEEMSRKFDSLSAELDERTRINLALQQENNNLKDKLCASHQSLEEWKEKETATLKQISKLTTELKKERAKTPRDELIAVRSKYERLQASHDQCVADKNAAERDLDSAIQALHDARCMEKEAIAAAARKERAGAVETQMVENALKQRFEDLQVQLETAQQQLDITKARNSLYENGHPLEEVLQKLEADIRRKDFDIKQLQHKHSLQKDRCLVLTKACDILKEKADLGPEFTFDEDEINIALKSEKNALLGVNQELLRQIEWLEDERNELMSQLRHRAIEIGEKGVKFYGMESAQLAQVIEFAKNLRRGTVELPLTDRSKDLLAQLSSIKAERKVDKITIERLEREIFALSEKQKDSIEEGQNTIIKHHVLNELKVDNKVRDQAEGNRDEDRILVPAAVDVQREDKNRGDAPNKELFQQLLHSTEENRLLKNKLRELLEKESSRSPLCADGAFESDANGVHSELTKRLHSLASNLSEYSSDICRLQNTVCMTSRLSTQVTTLNGIIYQKNKLIKNLTEKLALLKQAGKNVAMDRSTSSGLLNRTSRKESDGILSIKRSSLGDAALLLREKDELIRTIKSKLVTVEEAHANLLTETDRMRADIQTLVARLEEAEGVACESEVYRSNCIELKNALDDGKKDKDGLKQKLRRLSQASKEKDAKITDLEESLVRSKRVLSVSRQSRSRSEHNLKTSTDLITTLKEQIEKMETQITDLKQQSVAARDEKLKAQDKVRHMSSILQSASEKKLDEETIKASEEMQKRIAVQNKTNAVLASQNSKLRSELTRAKMTLQRDAKKNNEEDACSGCKSLESKVKQLERSLSNAKKDASSTQSKLQGCKKKVLLLEQQIADLRADNEKRDADTNYTSTNESLKQEISALNKKNESLLLVMKQIENDNNFDTLKLLRAENFQLKKENERLMKVDHLKLFEEIEGLKYRYNEAVMQLNQLATR